MALDAVSMVPVKLTVTDPPLPPEPAPASLIAAMPVEKYAPAYP